MITTLLVLAVFVFLSALLLVGARGFSEKLASVEELSWRLEPVNLEALKNLLNPDEDLYLERHLDRRELRSVRRERAVVAAGYVWRIAGNAAHVLHAAELAAKSATPEVAEEGARIAAYALRTRLMALKAMAVLGGSFLFPGRPGAAGLLEGYSALSLDIYYLTHSIPHVIRQQRVS